MIAWKIEGFVAGGPRRFNVQNWGLAPKSATSEAA